MQTPIEDQNWMFLDRDWVQEEDVRDKDRCYGVEEPVSLKSVGLVEAKGRVTGISRQEVHGTFRCSICTALKDLSSVELCYG